MGQHLYPTTQESGVASLIIGILIAVVIGVVIERVRSLVFSRKTRLTVSVPTQVADVHAICIDTVGPASFSRVVVTDRFGNTYTLRHPLLFGSVPESPASSHT